MRSQYNWLLPISPRLLFLLSSSGFILLTAHCHSSLSLDSLVFFPLLKRIAGHLFLLVLLPLSHSYDALLAFSFPGFPCLLPIPKSRYCSSLSPDCAALSSILHLLNPYGTTYRLRSPQSGQQSPTFSPPVNPPAPLHETISPDIQSFG